MQGLCEAELVYTLYYTTVVSFLNVTRATKQRTFASPRRWYEDVRHDEHGHRRCESVEIAAQENAAASDLLFVKQRPGSFLIGAVCIIHEGWLWPSPFLQPLLVGASTPSTVSLRPITAADTGPEPHVRSALEDMLQHVAGIDVLEG
eukprot:scaffold6450_cov415-Prasinococcus_capsulatus_cf.AAC.10